MDKLRIEELESLSDHQLTALFEDWIEQASQDTYKPDHAYLVGSKLASLNSNALTEPLLKWSRNRSELSLESFSEFVKGYWSNGGALDARAVESLYDFAASKPVDNLAWYLCILLALAEAFKQGAQVEGLRELLQRYESHCRQLQPGFSECLAESLAFNVSQ